MFTALLTPAQIRVDCRKGKGQTRVLRAMGWSSFSQLGQPARILTLSDWCDAMILKDSRIDPGDSAAKRRRRGDCTRCAVRPSLIGFDLCSVCASVTPPEEVAAAITLPRAIKPRRRRRVYFPMEGRRSL
jgi:hypothetical protein